MMKGTRSLRTETITDSERISEILDFWQLNTKELDSDPDFFLKIIDIRDDVVSPFLIVVRENDEPVSMLVARLESRKISARIGYFNVISMNARNINVTYGGFIGEDTPEIREIVLAHLLGELKKNLADIVFFHMVREDAGLLHDCKSLDIPSWRIQKSQSSLHYAVQCPESASDILGAKPSKARKRLNYDMRRVEKNLNGLHFKCNSSGENLASLMQNLEHVASKTYQRGLGVGFKNNKEWRTILELGFAKKWVDVWTLSANGKCISYIIGFNYKKRYLIYAKAFDPEYSHLSVGKYLQIRVLQKLADRGDCKVVDYGFGDAEYKKQFSTESWEEANMMIASSSFKSFILHMAINWCSTVDSAIRFLVAKLGLTKALKAYFRSKKSVSDGSD